MRLCAFADEASNELSGQIDALCRNNIKLLEIRGVDGENIKDISHAKIKKIKNELDKNGLKVWSLGSPMGKNDPENDFAGQLKDFEHLMESAQILGCTRIRLFSFFTRDEALALDRLERFLKVAPSGILLCHENEKGIFGDTWQNCEKIHKALPEIKAIFDPANFVQCDVDTKEAWTKLNPYVDYMHIKDALKTKQVVPCGMGAGNLEYLLGEYAKKGGEVLTLEPHLMEFYGLSELENGESLSHTPVYNDTNVAFDAGVSALKCTLDKLNLKY
ncbi:MAG: sugar phosphate isomerase/epimerase [Clostridia bacterium]|nr:sugar phosphate isomerase/epimerase [Clostridia bacterium]